MAQNLLTGKCIVEAGVDPNLVIMKDPKGDDRMFGRIGRHVTQWAKKVIGPFEVGYAVVPFIRRKELLERPVEEFAKSPTGAFAVLKRNALGGMETTSGGLHDAIRTESTDVLVSIWTPRHSGRTLIFTNLATLRTEIILIAKQPEPHQHQPIKVVKIDPYNWVGKRLAPTIQVDVDKDPGEILSRHDEERIVEEVVLKGLKSRIQMRLSAA